MDICTCLLKCIIDLTVGMSRFDLMVKFNQFLCSLEVLVLFRINSIRDGRVVLMSWRCVGGGLMRIHQGQGRMVILSHIS